MCLKFYRPLSAQAENFRFHFIWIRRFAESGDDHYYILTFHLLENAKCLLYLRTVKPTLFLFIMIKGAS